MGSPKTVYLVDKGAAVLGILAPQQKHDVSALIVHSLDNSV